MQAYMLLFYDGLLEIGCFKQAKSALLTEKSYAGWNYNRKDCQATCMYVPVKFEISPSQGGVGLEYFNDLRRRSRYEANPFGVGADAELKKWYSVHLWLITTVWSVKG